MDFSFLLSIHNKAPFFFLACEKIFFDLIILTHNVRKMGDLFLNLNKFFPPVRLKIIKTAFYRVKSISIDKFESYKALIYLAL